MEYQENIATGKTWRRCGYVELGNIHNGARFALFHEQDVTQIGDKTFINDVNRLRTEFDPAGSIPMRNPDTGELTGEAVTQAYLYQILHSLYLKVAMERDAANS